MDNQTILNIILGIITVYLGIRNYLNTSRKDTMVESQKMTEIQVKLSQVMDTLRDLQKDLRTATNEYRSLNERVIKLETKVEEACAQIKELKGKSDGKHESE